ncbi:helix-turn-helix domain-containing protein [Apilactobacillus timberlakei]|uniref:helix-turn-helix domain-containing protein n=1 Tax=Apilactobacillus timberlakei TaxID=2008380 RepID=UPI0011285880|nr:XRE family transcriptional regulator [Apilactobacillus timberlakei]
MEFFDRLKYYRKQNNLTQKSLSKLLNVSDKTVSSWENGRTVPDMNILRKLSTIFNISTDCLLEKDNLSDETNYIIKTCNKWIKYKYILIFLNMFLIFFTYFELIELFSFHFPIINILNLFCLFVSFLFIKMHGLKFLKKNNILFFLIVMFLNILLSHVGTSILSIINYHNELYIKGLILGRILLVSILSLLIIFEKDLINLTIKKI